MECINHNEILIYNSKTFVLAIESWLKEVEKNAFLVQDLPKHIYAYKRYVSGASRCGYLRRVKYIKKGSSRKPLWEIGSINHWGLQNHPAKEEYIKQLLASGLETYNSISKKAHCGHQTIKKIEQKMIIQ